MIPSHPFSDQEYAERLSRIRAVMKSLELSALITTNQANVRYATGFRGEPRTLLLTQTEVVLYTSFRTLPWAEEQTHGVQSHLELSTAAPPLDDIVLRLSNEKQSIAVDLSLSHLRFQEMLSQFSVHDLKPLDIIEQVRRIKSPHEITLMKRSQQINESILATVIPKIRPGMSEREVQGLMLVEMAKRNEVDGYSFNPIVAAGGNAWEIHHLPNDSIIRNDDLLLLDLGIVYQGYASDMTRTICMGKASSQMKEVYDTVRLAQEAAIVSMRPSIETHTVDQAARSIITQAGYGRSFTHGLGHSIGLETHDPGLNLSPSSPNEILVPGMAFTVEPGIYLQDAFGVRTEDVIVITENGNTNITEYPKDLLELDF